MGGSRQNLILRDLTLDDEAAFLVAVDAFAGESLHWITFEWTPDTKWADHIERLRKNAAGEDLAPERVPASLLYGFVDGVIVGRVSIRHELNEMLRYRGGHIGYSVVPAYRRRGYAAEMFRQSLPVCRRVGLKRIMITCDDSNEASWRLLETAGAKLEEIFFDTQDGSNARRYWLDI